jgi:hypothetical protein
VKVFLPGKSESVRSLSAQGITDTIDCVAFHLPLVKVNSNGPLLNLTAAFSIATVTQALESNSQGIQCREYVNWICENVT